MATSYVIHVLLVENNRTDLNQIKEILESFSYKVTAIEQAFEALSILSEEKFQYDVVMANVDLLDSCTLYLLQATSQMNFLMILLCDDKDDHSITRALELGAYLCIKKPITREKIENLWQHVVRQKVRAVKEKDLCRNFPEYNATQIEHENEYMEKNSNSHNGSAYKNDGETRDTWDSNMLQQDNNPMFKRKIWTEWTPELHEKFMNAAAQLGDGRCYPKDILELMNIPGLTRMQVASHLQKCRTANWIPPSQRKNKQAYIKMLTPRRTKAPRSKTVKFGSMPQVINNSSSFHEQQAAPIGQQTQARDDSGANNNHDESYYNLCHPQLISNDHCTYPLAQSNETLNMGQQGYTFGAMAEPFVYGVQNANTNTNFSSSYQIPETSEFPYMEGSSHQNFSLMQHELGMGYDGGFPALFSDQVYYNQMPTLVNNSSTNNPWNQGVRDE